MFKKEGTHEMKRLIHFFGSSQSLRSPREIKAEVNLRITVLHGVCQSQTQDAANIPFHHSKRVPSRANVCRLLLSQIPRDGRRVPLCLFVLIHVILPV